MLETLFSTVLAMSLTGSVLWLLLRLVRPLTGRLCSARWERGSRALVLCAYLLPVGLLLRPSLAPLPVITLPAAFTPYGTAASIPPIWALTGQDAKPGPPLALPGLLAMVWFAGALAAALWLVLRQRRFLSALRRTALRVEAPEVLETLAALCKELKLANPPALYTSERIRTPLGAGLFHPALYLPEVDMERRELELILRHELQHLRRHDLPLKWLSLLALSLHWFDPLAWAFCREWGFLCETACDEAVTRGLSGEERRFYGAAILNVLYRAAPPGGGVCSSLCAGPAGLELRLRRILRPRRGRGGQAVCTLAAAGLLLGLLPLSATVHAWAEPYHGWNNAGDYQANMARQALDYLPFGVTYDANADLFFYRGEALSAFVDILSATEEQREQFPDFTHVWKCGWFRWDDQSRPAYRAVRDERQVLTGIALMTAEEADGYRSDNADSVCFNGYFTSGNDDFYASDPDWDSLPPSVRDWAGTVPPGTAAILEEGNSGYLCYGGLHCPWQLKPTEGGLDVYFYTIQGSDPSRPCVIRYTAKTVPENVRFYVDDEPLV